MPVTRAKPEIHPKDGRPIHQFASEAEFEKWLMRHAERSDGIWIKFAKKGSGIESVTYPQALDVALCYGWIDSLLLSLDTQFYLQRFTPRGKRSTWSKINCAKVQSLISSGRMTAQGMKQVEAAKQDGRWERAYDGKAAIEVPADFQAVLRKNKPATKFFETLKGRKRSTILMHILDAKKPETRQRRIGQFVEMLAAGRTLV